MVLAGSATAGALCETGQRRVMGVSGRSLSDEGKGMGDPPPRPQQLMMATPYPHSPAYAGSRGVVGVNRGGLRFRAGQGILDKTPSASPGRSSRHRQGHGQASTGGLRCSASHNNRASGCGRLKAAFDPTGLIALRAWGRICYWEESRAWKQSEGGRFGGP